MTKYDKSIIYKLCCKDPSITDIYIGSTTNFKSRKYQHKIVCNNQNGENYLCYKYVFIRDNGGWENWDMVQIKEFKCENKRELEAEERKIIEQTGATLNKIMPTRTDKEWREKNKDTIKEYRKQYYEKNKDEINKNQKEYRKQYYEKNKDEINKKRRELYKKKKS